MRQHLIIAWKGTQPFARVEGQWRALSDPAEGYDKNREAFLSFAPDGRHEEFDTVELINLSGVSKSRKLLTPAEAARREEAQKILDARRAEQEAAEETKKIDQAKAALEEHSAKLAEHQAKLAKIRGVPDSSQITPPASEGKTETTPPAPDQAPQPPLDPTQTDSNPDPKTAKKSRK